MKEYIKFGIGFYIGLKIARFADKVLKDLVNGREDNSDDAVKEENE